MTTIHVSKKKKLPIYKIHLAIQEEEENRTRKGRKREDKRKATTKFKMMKLSKLFYKM